MALKSESQIYRLYAWRDNNIQLSITQGEGKVKIAEFQLMDNDEAFDLSDTSVVKVIYEGVKQNGQACYIECEIIPTEQESENGRIAFYIETGITDICGTVKGDIKVLTNKGSLKFYGVNFLVKPSPDNIVEATGQFSALDKALAKVQILTPEGTIAIDDELSNTSVNPLQNKVITQEINKKIDKNEVYKKSEIYNKTETDSFLREKANSSEVYSRTEIDGKIQSCEKFVDLTKSTATITVDNAIDSSTIYYARVGDYYGLLICSSGGNAWTQYFYTSTGKLMFRTKHSMSDWEEWQELSGDIEDGSVTEKKLSADVMELINSKADKDDVYSADEADEHFLSAEEPNGSVNTEHIVNNAVTEEKLSSAVRQKLNSGGGHSTNIDFVAKTNDVAFAITDEDGNTVLVVDNEGNTDFNISEELEYKLKQIIPTPEDTPKGEFYADVYMIPCVGQSLAINTDAGASTFSTTEELSFNHNLQNTNIQDMNTGFCEAFKIAAKHYGVELPRKFKIITCVVGGGGQSINVFGKGSNYYNTVLNNIRTAYNACYNVGLKMSVIGFMWTQGEEDMRVGGTPSAYGSGNWNPFDYHKKLRNMIDNYNIDIKTITGQKNEVCCFSYQTASHNAYMRYPRIAFEQEKLAEMDSRMLLAKTMYDVNYNADNVHCPAGTYRNMGNRYGLAAFTKCVLQKDFKWTHPTKFDLEDNVLYINFETPVKPLVLDTELVTNLADGNYGFNIINIPDETATSQTQSTISEATTRITSVELVGDTKLKITMSRNPVEGERLTYGVNGTGWENTSGYNISGVAPRSGHLEGARGCLRDSSDIVNNNSGATLPYLFNWCVMFEHKFGEEA